MQKRLYNKKRKREKGTVLFSQIWEIINLWRSGLSKNVLARIYKRNYNQKIKIIRLDPMNRHSGKFINEFQALVYVEKIIYEYIKKSNKF